VRKRSLLLAVALLVSCSSTPSPADTTARVDPEQYDAFFLWAGVRPPPALDRARIIYLLDGEVRVRDNTRMVRLRPETPRVRHAQIWLTVRLERLDWEERLYEQVLNDLATWDASGNQVLGLQLDFDARTRGLDQYASFLRGVRERLPERYRLSITGLMDWSANGDASALATLNGVVDEVVIQTYQGRHTVPGYEQYLTTLARLPMPYRIGLVEGGEWQAPPSLASDPRFLGYVVFLLPGG
jgi:hypothetical protein